MTVPEILASQAAEIARLRHEHAQLWGWVADRLLYESGQKGKLFLRPDKKPDKRHFRTPDDAIAAALKDEEP